MPTQAHTSLATRAKKWAGDRLKDFIYSYYLPRQYKKCANRLAAQGIGELGEPAKVLLIYDPGTDMPPEFTCLWKALEANPRFQPQFAAISTPKRHFIRYMHDYRDLMPSIVEAQFIVLREVTVAISCLPLRPGTQVIQLWHGCGAFKKFGMSTATKIFGSNREQLLRHPQHANTSLVTVSSPEVVWAYEEAMCMSERQGVVRPLGVSRTDVFFDEDFVREARQQVEHVVTQHGACADVRGKKIALYAPTFRGRTNAAKAPDQLDLSLLARQLGNEWILLVKQHPHVKNRPPIPEDARDFAFDVTGQLPIDALLAASDACITDYSSLVFEYALFERPMVFFAYDLADYDDWRGFYYDYDAMTPGPVVTTTQEVADFLENADERFDREQMRAFKEKFMSACDGHATERIVQYMEQQLSAPGKDLRFHSSVAPLPAGVENSGSSQGPNKQPCAFGGGRGSEQRFCSPHAQALAPSRMGAKPSAKSCARHQALKGAL